MPAQAGTQNLQITRVPDFAGVTIGGLFRTSQGEQPAQDRRQAGSYNACSFFAAWQIITARQAMALHLLVEGAARQLQHFHHRGDVALAL